MRYIITAILFVLVSCDNNNHLQDYNFHFQIDPRLEQNGECYDLFLGPEWQTTHRISGSITNNEVLAENVKFHWESSLYWYLGDTLGYIVKRGLTDDLIYKNYDTLYIVGFSGEEVPTSNQASYSNANGEVNNMIAPVRSMRGDTMILRWWYEYDNYQSEWDSIRICLR